MPHRRAAGYVLAHAAVIALVAGAIVNCVLVVLVLSLNSQRIQDNRARIADIQASRIESCRRTYEGVREVFQPFTPPESAQSADQRQRWVTFNRTVDELKARCPRQVREEP